MIKINKKYLISSIFGGVFLTFILGGFNGGFPFPWYSSTGTTTIDLTIFLVDTVIWTIFDYILISVFIKHKLPF